jgi:hypothetical protein
MKMKGVGNLYQLVVLTSEKEGPSHFNRQKIFEITFNPISFFGQ